MPTSLPPHPLPSDKSPLVEALRAIEQGDPFATRKAVDAIGVALDVLSESEAKAPATTPAVPQSRR